MLLRKIYILTILSLFFGAAYAGNAKVLVTNDRNNTIIVKWYTETVYTDDPVNVYRQEKGKTTWTKLNHQPVRRKDHISQELKEKDPAFDILEDHILNTSASESDGITRLIIMIKSVEYPGFSDFLGIRYVDEDIAAGMEYRYKITGLKNNNEQELGISDWIEAGPFIPQKAPEAFSAIQNNYSVDLRWQHVQDRFMGVYIYRSSGKGKKESLTSVPIIVSTDEKGNYPDVFFRDDSLEVGTSYTYQIEGIDYFGRRSELSNEFRITIKDITPPPAPGNIVTEISGTRVRLYWEIENNPDLAGFHVYRTEYGDTVPERLNSDIIYKDYQTYSDSVTRTGLYYYKVSSVDNSGNEAFSHEYPVEIKDIFPPSKPRLLNAYPDSGKIVLSWQKNSEPDVLGYLIYRTIDSDRKSYILVNSTPVVENRFTDYLPAEAKNRFLYRIVAVDSAYNRSEYSDFAITRLPDVIPPQKPVIRSVKQQEKTLVIEWQPAFEDDLAGYNVFRSEEKSTPQKLNVNLIKDVDFFTDRSVVPGIKYKYSVVAVDSSGNESYRSDEYTAGLDLTPEGDIEFKNVSVAYKDKKQHVIIKWDVNQAGLVKGFVVYRKTGEQENFKPISGLIQNKELTDDAVKTGMEYHYQIKAFDLNNSFTESRIYKIEIK